MAVLRPARRFNTDVEQHQILPPSATRGASLTLRYVLSGGAVVEQTPNRGRNHNQIRAEIVTTYKQLQHAHAIRSICFMEERGVRARHEFDGNDYQATHVIVYSGDEPIGTLRIRWFKDFAKFERTSFRKAYRNVHVLKTSAQFAFDHVARKGFDKVITHAQPKYARLWRVILGFRPVENKPAVYFEGHDEPYVELVKELTPPANAISQKTDSTILFRIEGFWDQPSEYEAATAA
jgi:hypothetical protein